MNLKTRIDLWKLKRAMGPSMAFKAALRKDLNTAWSAKYGGSSPLYHIVTARIAGAFAVVTMLLTGGGWVYAYASPEVTEGSVLYPVKEVIETVEEVIKITPEAKAKFYIKKLERREAEREVLEKKIQLPKIREIKQGEVKIDKKENIEKFVDKDVKEEKREEAEKIKVELEEYKIKRTEKSIEKIEEQLEKTRQIIEKNESKNLKLREELKNRAEQRSQRIKKQLEIKAEMQKNNQIKLQQLRQRSGIKTEVRNTSSLTR